jgi:tRNA A37 threonylcarbamoyladenosine modification protein TsaB
VYIQQFDADGSAIAGPQIVSVHDALANLPGWIDLVLGSGARMLAEAAQREGRMLRADLADLLPEARDLAMLALDLPASSHPLAPLYLRPPDAKPQTDKSIARVSA